MSLSDKEEFLETRSHHVDGKICESDGNNNPFKGSQPWISVVIQPSEDDQLPKISEKVGAEEDN